MAYQTPLSTPPALRAGDTATWKISLANYPASQGWVLSYSLLKSGTRLQFSASASGDDHLVDVPAATTAAWAPGTYQAVGRVSKSGEARTVIDQPVEILPDLAAAAAGYDARGHAQRVLDALNAWIESHDPAVAEYEVAGRHMKYIPMGELLKLRSRYQAEAAREQAAQTGKSGRVYLRF